MPERRTYSVSIEGVERELPIFQAGPHLKIAVFNLLGDTEVISAASQGIAARIKDIEADVLVTAEAKSIPLIYHLALLTGKAWVVLRKEYKPYMGEALSAETLSITTGKPQTLYLDEKDQTLVRGKRVILVDDVISTGSTLQGMRLLMEKAGAQVAAEAAVFTEGERARWAHIISLAHLPLFTDGEGS